MDPTTLDLNHPEILRYLSGEISFEAWLENQQSQQEVTFEDANQHEDVPPGNNISSSFDTAAESSAIFSSWGSTFTGGTDKEQIENEQQTEESEDDEEDDVNVVQSTSTEVMEQNLIVNSPSFENMPLLSEEMQGVQGRQLIPFIESLVELIPNCKVRHLGRRKQSLVGDDEVPDIMKDFQNFQFRKRGRRKGKSVVRKLPELLRLQMGQANLFVAKGDFKKAADICMEIVREAPYSGLAFKTLAFIYEEQGNKEMSLQYSLISAFLDCKDAQEWKELSKKCLDAGNMKQSLVCFDRACRASPGNISLHWERASMYLEVQEYKKSLDIYQYILKILIPSNPEPYIKLAKDTAQFYHKNGLIDKAGETLEAAFDACPHYQDLEGVNTLSEILIEAKKYGKVIKLISLHCNVVLPSCLQEPTTKMIKKNEKESVEKLNSFINKSQDKDFTEVTAAMATEVAEAESASKEYTTLQPVKFSTLDEKRHKTVLQVPVELPVDIRIKLALCLIHCGGGSYVESIIHPLFSEDINVVGDLVLDVAEAYFETNQFQDSLNHLLRLVASEKYNQAAVWLKVAECYESLCDIEESIGAYFQVLALAPLHASVRLSLASALRSVGRNEDAITVLAEYDEACVEDDGDEKITITEQNRLKLEEYEQWYKKCLVMYQDGRSRDFIYHGYILMYNYLMSGYSYQKKQTVGKALMWELMLKILNVSIKLKQNRKAINLIEQAFLYKPYSESKKYRLELDYLLTTLYFVSAEYSKAFDSFRVLITHESEAHIGGVAVWNLFTQIANKMLDKRHHRYTLRLLFKKPKLIPLIIHNGNNSHMSGTYKYAIGEFSRAFREWPRYPLCSLLLSISFLHLSCQKFHTTRHTSILHGIIFLFQYFNLREANQEACYNVGRAFHQIGLVHMAVYYYEKALRFPLHEEKNVSDISKVTYHPFIDLHRETAYNLSLIYKSSGNNDLARKILHKYCWV